MEAKKIIITGGATRVGAAIAKSLAGYDINITIHYYKSKNLANKLKQKLEDLGSNVFLIKADLNNSLQVQRLIKDAFNKMKGLDCLINNASVFENDNLTNLNDKSFSKHMNVNLKAPALLTQNFKKYVKRNYGVIINIIDQRIEKLTPYFLSYTSAMKLAPNIRVNAISPGPTLKNKRQSESHFKKQWKSVLLKKQVDLENINETVKFLIKNDNITGEIINVDSGQRLAWLTPDIINIKE